MKILSNCHTHTDFCDGLHSAREMVETAVALGFRSLGFTSHAPQYFDLPYAIAPEKEGEYQRELRALREEFQGRIRLHIGIERDFFSFAVPSHYDYWIASVHYIPFRGRFYSVDGKPEELYALCQSAFGGDGLALARAYYDLLTAYAVSYRPPVIGHFDLIKKNNARLSLFDSSSPAYEEIVRNSLRTIAKCGSMLEVNTGGMARRYLQEPYPSSDILRIWQSLGGHVIASSDCHDKALMDYAFDQLPGYLEEAGFDGISVLGCGDALFEAYPLSAHEIPFQK